MGKYDAAKGPEPDPEAEAPPPDPAQPDLRRSSYQKDNIRVERSLNSNLGGDGHLARGNMTRFQSLNFSVRGRPADPGERDPVFVERETGAEKAERAEEAEKRDAAAPVAGEVPSAPSDSSAPSAGVLGALKKLFGG